MLTTLAIAFAGGFAGRTRLGFGTARGSRRDDLAAQAAVLDADGYAAGVGLRLREAGLLAMRALYAVNRLGPCPEYVRVYALVGYFTAMIKLRGVAGRCLDRAARTAAGLGDPALSAYVEWVRGCAMLFGGHDDGTAWEHTITRHARWFGPAQLIPGHATVGLRLLLRGYTAQAGVEYERGLRRVPDHRLVAGSSFSMLGVMIPGDRGPACRRRQGPRRPARGVPGRHRHQGPAGPPHHRGGLRRHRTGRGRRAVRRARRRVPRPRPPAA